MQKRIAVPPIKWEIVDVELGHVFYAETDEHRDSIRKAIELMNHRAIVRKVV